QVGPPVLNVEPRDVLAAVVEGVDLAVGSVDRKMSAPSQTLGRSWASYSARSCTALLDPSIAVRTLNWWSVTKCHQRGAGLDVPVRSLDRLLTRSSDERLPDNLKSDQLGNSCRRRYSDVKEDR